MALLFRGRKIRAIKAKMGPQIRAEVQGSAQDIVSTQKTLAPVDAGDLKASIKFTMGDEDPPKYAHFKSKARDGDPRLTAIITAGNSNVRYPSIVEFGTAPHLNGGMFAGTQHPGTAPNPFFWPGYRAHKKKVKARIARAVNKAIKAST
jgi:hypothetical protein